MGGVDLYRAAMNSSHHQIRPQLLAARMGDSSMRSLIPAEPSGSNPSPQTPPTVLMQTLLQPALHCTSGNMPTGFHTRKPISSTPHLASMLNGDAAADVAGSTSRPTLDNASDGVGTPTYTMENPTQLVRPARSRRHPVWRYFRDMDNNVS